MRRSGLSVAHSGKETRGARKRARHLASSVGIGGIIVAAHLKRFEGAALKKRLVLVWTAALMTLALVAAPTTAATTGFTFTKVDGHCFGAQGQNVYFRVRLTAAGSTS